MIGELDLGEDEKPKIGHGTWADVVISFWLGELGGGGEDELLDLGWQTSGRKSEKKNINNPP